MLKAVWWCSSIQTATIAWCMAIRQNWMESYVGSWWGMVATTQKVTILA
ncbi:Uncharacterised protein [Vibrio cholerae]|uniref:Uncharacterized protein n=1 Tax=Vibrio cholerae TaxID=666 RepID=A0A655ZJ65_VIBCL|nr:Uncharacterised protein [Vibrio cholerae]